MTSIRSKKKPLVPVVTMITPGRRALGEDWSKVTIGYEADGANVLTTETKPAEAPAHHRSIIVPAMGNVESAHVDFLLEEALGKALSATEQHMTVAEWGEHFNALFHDYVEAKLAALTGRSQYGAGGMHQRQRVNREANV